MTLMDVTFPYRVPPGALQMTALGCVREVYGVRKISFDEAKKRLKWNTIFRAWPKPISQGCCTELVWIYLAQ